MIEQLRGATLLQTSQRGWRVAGACQCVPDDGVVNVSTSGEQKKEARDPTDKS